MNESVTGTGRGVPAHRGPGRVTFWGSLCAELLKLRGLVSTWVLMGLLMVGIPVVAAIVAAVVRFGGVSSTSSAVMFWTYFGSALGNMILVAGIFGVMAVTTEFTTRSIQSSLLAVPRRLTFMGSKLLAVGLYVMAAAFVGVTLGALSTLLVSGGAGLFDLSFRDLRLPVIVMLGGPAALVLVAIMAAGLGGGVPFHRRRGAGAYRRVLHPPHHHRHRRGAAVEIPVDGHGFLVSSGSGLQNLPAGGSRRYAFRIGVVLVHAELVAERNHPRSVDRRVLRDRRHGGPAFGCEVGRMRGSRTGTVDADRGTTRREGSESATSRMHVTDNSYSGGHANIHA